MDAKHFGDQLEQLSALADPARRRLYLRVCEHGGDVSRVWAARASGMSRAMAAFHLDKLVEAGLLEATFRRLGRRQGPGAGRPSKLYRRSTAQIELSLPQRRYEWAARLLARAVASAPSEATLSALRTAAREQGATIGAELSGATRASDPLRRASRALAGCGFEPARGDDGRLVLRNCPFDALRSGCREVICGMNLALIEGVLQGLAEPGVSATLEPAEERCCVVLAAAAEN